MFELIVGNKKKIFKFFNFLLLISFIWIIFINTSYFFEKIIFGNHEHFFDLKLIHNSFIETLNGKNIYISLSDKNVIGDWREPNVIRMAPAPLYNSFEDVFEFIERLKEAVQENKVK